jgi:hypothetical protein
MKPNDVQFLKIAQPAMQNAKTVEGGLSTIIFFFEQKAFQSTLRRAQGKRDTVNSATNNNDIILSMGCLLHITSDHAEIKAIALLFSEPGTDHRRTEEVRQSHLFTNRFNSLRQVPVLQFSMKHHGEKKLRLKYRIAKLMRLKTRMNLLSGKDGVWPGVPLRLTLELEEDIVQHIEAADIRIIDNDGIAGHSTEFLDKMLPLPDMGYQTKCHHDIELLIGKGQGEQRAVYKTNSPLGKYPIQPLSAAWMGSRDCHSKAFPNQRNGQLCMPSADIENRTSAEIL